MRDVDWIDDPPRISVLVTAEHIFVGANRDAGPTPTIDRDPRWPARAWDQLGAALVDMHDPGSPFRDANDVEIAVESREGRVVDYQDLVTAMDRAIRAGFPDVHLRYPQELMTRPVW